MASICSICGDNLSSDSMQMQAAAHVQHFAGGEGQLAKGDRCDGSPDILWCPPPLERDAMVFDEAIIGRGGGLGHIAANDAGSQFKNVEAGRRQRLANASADAA
jgi:hypothetical protein